jgi:hypothetical protein
MIAALSHVLIHHHTKKVANTEPKQVYGGKQSFVSERTIKDIIIRTCDDAVIMISVVS